MKHDVENGVLTITIEEDLVAANIKRQLTEAHEALADNPSIEQIIINIEKVDTIDSLGINLLVGVYKEARKGDTPFKVTGSSPGIKRLFMLYSLSAHFGIED